MSPNITQCVRQEQQRFNESNLILTAVDTIQWRITKWDGSVGIATRYGLNGPGVESRCGRDFPHPFKPPLRPTQPPIQWYRVFPGGKAAWSWRWLPTSSRATVKERVELYLCLPLWTFVACSKVNFTFTFTFVTKLKGLYSHYGRDCTVSLFLPRTVQSLRPWMYSFPIPATDCTQMPKSVVTKMCSEDPVGSVDTLLLLQV
jgi:hypothetical protein